MKKLILLLPCAIFPYSLLFALYCIFTGFLMESLFDNNAFVLVIYLFVLFIIAIICNMIFLTLSLLKKWDSNIISFANMIIKLIQIPAYILIFILGIIFTLTLFTLPFSVFFIIFDYSAIFLTGLIGVAAIVRCHTDGKTSETFSVISAFLQFIFCIDVISAIIVFIKSKSKSVK